MSAILALVNDDQETLKFYAESLKEKFLQVQDNVKKHVSAHKVPVKVYFNDRNPSVLELDVVDSQSLATAIFQVSLADDFRLSANIRQQDSKSYHLTQSGHAEVLSDFEDMVNAYIGSLTEYHLRKEERKRALNGLDY